MGNAGVSEWVYIGVGYILTWVTLGGYMVYLLRRRVRAARALGAAKESGR